MVQFGSRLVELYHHLVTSADEAVLQVRYFLVRQYGSCLSGNDVSQHGLRCNVLVKLIPAGRSRCRLLRLWVEFIDDVTIVVALYHLTIYIRNHLNRIVLLTLLTVEAQIGLQTSLVTIRTLRCVGVDECLRKCLCKEAEFIDVTLQWCFTIVRILIDHVA